MLAKNSRISQTARSLTSFQGYFLSQENGKEQRGQKGWRSRRKRSTGQHPPHHPLTILTKYKERLTPFKITSFSLSTKFCFKAEMVVLYYSRTWVEQTMTASQQAALQHDLCISFRLHAIWVPTRTILRDELWWKAEVETTLSSPSCCGNDVSSQQ